MGKQIRREQHGIEVYGCTRSVSHVHATIGEDLHPRDIGFVCLDALMHDHRPSNRSPLNLVVEAELHDVAIGHDVFLALNASLALGAGLSD